MEFHPALHMKSSCKYASPLIQILADSQIQKQIVSSLPRLPAVTTHISKFAVLFVSAVGHGKLRLLPPSPTALTPFHTFLCQCALVRWRVPCDLGLSFSSFYSSAAVSAGFIPSTYLTVLSWATPIEKAHK